MKLIYYGKVLESGKLHINNKKQLLKDVLMFLGKDITLTIERKRRKRSLSQNAFYWSVVVPMCKEGLIDTGYKVTLEQTHDFLKSEFLKKELVNEKTGEVLQSVKSTTELTTSEFMDLIAEVQQWAAEFLSIQIPDPGEQTHLEL